MTADLQLPRDLAAQVNAELREGERIVWMGQPIPKLFAKSSLGAVLFGIPWTAFALFWMAGASGFQMPDFSKGFGLFPLFGVPFVLIGFGMLSSPYWMRRRAQKTAYLITDQRCVLLVAGYRGRTTVRSFHPHQLGDLHRVQSKDGSGDLILQSTWSTDSEGSRQATEHGFIGIRDVKAVEDLVRKLCAEFDARKAAEVDAR